MDILYTLYVVSIIPAIYCSYDVLMNGKSEQGTNAWLVLLISFPVATVPAYLCFGGRKYTGYATDRRNDLDDLEWVDKKLEDGVSEFKTDFPTELRPLNKLQSSSLLEGNHAEVLEDADTKFSKLEKIIKEAESYIFIQYFIYRDDEIGRKIGDLLVKKAESGVSVHLMYDSIGSYALNSKYIKWLRDHHVKVTPFGKFKFIQNRFQINFRNHRKLVVVDGIKGMTGGINVGNEYVTGGKSFSDWRDTHLYLEGPVVLQLQKVFLEDLYTMEKEVPAVMQWKSRKCNDIKCLSIPTGPADKKDICKQMLITAINSATNELLISTPYFVPPAEISAALINAALRGVNIKVIIPASSDSLLVKYSSLTYVNELQKSGIQFYCYQKGFIHQKIMLIDNEYSYIGSCNLDNRSIMLNFELTICIKNSKMNAYMKEIINNDLSNSIKLESDFFEKQNITSRLFSRACRVFAPLL